jgi:hypothetical protein
MGGGIAGKEDEGTEASEHGMTRTKGREGKKTFPMVARNLQSSL